MPLRPAPAPALRATTAIASGRIAVVARNAGAGAGLSGIVRKQAYLGGSMEYTIESELGPLFVTSTEVDRPHAIGDSVQLELSPHGVVPIAAA